jgi:sulfotransferase
LREAVYGPQSKSDRLLLVRYESLTINPIGTLAAVYHALGEPLFAHDVENIEPCYDMVDFDARPGTPGLHDVGRSVRVTKRASVLPPDLFARYESDAFWEDPSRLPTTVRLL